MGLERFRGVGALPPQGGWKGELALDRERTPPRPVELCEVAREVASDGVALAALLRTAELATRVIHPAVLPVLGLVERAGGMALASEHRAGVALPELLAAGGPLAPPLAIRVVGEIARALEAVHALVPAGERPLVHGAVGPEAIRIGLAGEVLLTGLGRPSAASPTEDAAALRALLGVLDPEPPPELAAALDALAGPGATAGALWRALEGAVAPADPARLALWLERMAPEALAAARGQERAVAQALEEEAAAQAPARPVAATPPPRAAQAAASTTPPAPAAASAIPEPDWFAPPSASPPALKGHGSLASTPPPTAPVASPASPSPPVQRLPSSVESAGAGAGASLLDRLGDERLRAPIVAAAGLLGLVLGWLGGR